MVKKKPSHPPHEDHPDETWLIPYSDLLTLLLALFIVLFASSSLDKNKAAQIQYALAAAFGSGGMEEDNGTIINFMNDVKDLNLEQDGVIISSDANGATLEMTSINLFDKGSVILKPEAIPVIKKISLLLNSNKYKKYRISVEGHTDDTNESDTLPSNWELSSARASSIVRYLIDRFKIMPNLMAAIGYADTRPADKGTDSSSLAKNRRVEIVVQRNQFKHLDHFQNSFLKMDKVEQQRRRNEQIKIIKEIDHQEMESLGEDVRNNSLIEDSTSFLDESKRLENLSTPN